MSSTININDERLNNNRISFFKDDNTFNDFNRRRSSSSFSDDFHSNLNNFRNINEMLPPIPPKRIFSSERLHSRSLSNQSSDNDSQKRLSFDSLGSSNNNVNINNNTNDNNNICKSTSSSKEWSRIPKLSSKNNTKKRKTKIKHDSVVEAIIQDSTSTTSSEEKPSIENVKFNANAEPFKSPYPVRRGPTHEDTIISIDDDNYINNNNINNGSYEMDNNEITTNSKRYRAHEKNQQFFPHLTERNIELMNLEKSKDNSTKKHSSAMIRRLDSTMVSDNEFLLHPIVTKSLPASANTVMRNISKTSTSSTTRGGAGGVGTGDDNDINSSSSSNIIKRDLSPAIVKDTVTIGSANRLPQPRPHKKTSFAIITELSPIPSRASSPTGGRLSPFLGKGFKGTSSSRASSRASSPPHSNSIQMGGGGATDIDAIKPIVQFNMSAKPEKMTISRSSTPRSILQRRNHSHDSITDFLSYRDREMESYEIETDVKLKTLIHIPTKISSSLDSTPPKPFSILPQLSPTLQQKHHSSFRNSALPTAIGSQLNQSLNDLPTTGSHSASIIRTSINPKSSQRGLLRIVSSASSNSSSRIPRRKSLTSILSPPPPSNNNNNNNIDKSTDKSHNNKESLTTNNLIDLGVMSTPSRTSARISKPSSLSPIIGTPNKEQSEQMLMNEELLQRENTNSTKIPTLRSSGQTNIKSKMKMTNLSSSKPNSKTNSREPSPDKKTSVSTTGKKTADRSESVNHPTTSTTMKRRGSLKISPPQTIPKSIKSTIKSKPETERTTTKNASASLNSTLNSTNRISSIRSTSFRRNTPITSSSTKQEPSSRRKEPSSSSTITTTKTIKRDSSILSKNSTSTIKREPSNLKREPSNLKRETSNLKRESSNLKREPSNLKRENSNLKRETSNLKRENSNLKQESISIGSNKKEISLKRQNSNIKRRETSALSKNNSDSNLMKKMELEKKGSIRKERRRTSSAGAEPDDDDDDDTDKKFGKLIPLTKSNVISMTTAAIAAQPVHITTTVTNQLHARASSSSNLLAGNSGDGDNNNNNNNNNTMETPIKSITGNNNAVSTMSLSDELKDTILATPATILEKSQLTLENIQKQINEATEEIQKTIEENLTDLKTLENDMKIAGEEYRNSPVPFEKRESSKTLKSLKDDVIDEVPEPLNEISEENNNNVSASAGNATVATTGGSIRAVTAANTMVNKNIKHENLLKTHKKSDERISESAINALPEVDLESGNNNNNNNSNNNQQMDTSNIHQDINTKSESFHENNSKSENGDDDEQRSAACCCCKCSNCCTPFCMKFCMPCQRLNAKCCKSCSNRKVNKTTVKQESEKNSCWSKMRCCKRKSNNLNEIDETKMKKKSQTSMANENVSGGGDTGGGGGTVERGKCRLCIDKFLCCKKTNKIESTPDIDDEEIKKCCFCIPCRRKVKDKRAWQNRRESIISHQPPVKKGCLSMICNKLMCCGRNKDNNESRRTSMNSKKQSIAPTLPPEDTRPKLDMVLVEHGSMMKGAIPVLPLCLAWFCLICNCIIPGFGTIISGLLCVCIGIPRFSQRDTARARIGSFIINCIVGVAQAFTLLFCLVGWGWSIWWGTIMLRTARKRKKIKDAEAAVLHEEQMVAQNHRDLEAGGGGGGVGVVNNSSSGNAT